MQLLESSVMERLRCALERFGEVFENTAEFSLDNHVVSVQTCFGPEQTGKSINQDAGLAIHCRNGSPIKWACAIADGVGTSPFSEVGSRAATWAALVGLCESTQRQRPKSQALDAVCRAHETIRILARSLEADLTKLRFKPKYLPAPAYRHAVERRSCFQTTLCIVWCDGHSIYIASVGDSGALLATKNEPCKCLFFPDVSSSYVNPISAGLESIGLDYWVQTPVGGVTVAVFTDGVAKSLAEQHGSQLANFGLHSFIQKRTASELLAVLSDSTSEEAADNMSLLVVRAS